MNSKPTVLIAGGAGYIGSFVTRAFLKSNFEVIVYDNLSTGHKQSVPKEAKFIHGDVLDVPKLTNTLEENKVEAIVHLCAFSLVGESVTDPIKYYHNNVAGAVALFQAMQASGVKRLVFSSTAAVYGDIQTKITEDMPKNPINPYGVSKYIIEEMLSTTPFDAVALRYFNAGGATKGCGESHSPETHLVPCVCLRFLNNEHAQIFGDDYETKDGSCVRDYIHVEDLARAHVLAAERLIARNQTGLEAFNLGSADGFTVKEVVAEIQKHLPGEADIVGRRPGDPAFLVADNKKAGEVLGWKNEKHLSDIVESAVNWHKSGMKFE